MGDRKGRPYATTNVGAQFIEPVSAGSMNRTPTSLMMKGWLQMSLRGTERSVAIRPEGSLRARRAWQSPAPVMRLLHFVRNDTACQIASSLPLLAMTSNRATPKTIPSSYQISLKSEGLFL